jgi:hypothetical protein
MSMSRTDFGWTPRRIAPSLLDVALCLGAPAPNPLGPTTLGYTNLTVFHIPVAERLAHVQPEPT